MKEDKLFPIEDLMQKRNWSLGELLAMAEEHPGNYGMYLGEFTSRMESYATALKCGILTVEEVRKLENLSNTPRSE